MNQTVGIIAEYNPFHSGHLHHLLQSRCISGSDYSICVMSGDYVQRGAPALFSKYARAQAAVRAGVSLVLELPLPWCLSSAEGFARGGVALLKATGVVRFLSFGSEAGELTTLCDIAHVLSTPEYDKQLNLAFQKNESFAVSRDKAVGSILGEQAVLKLRKPNNNLAVEYLRAAETLGADFDYITVPRIDSEHDGTGSASELRELFSRGEDIVSHLPEPTRCVAKQEITNGRALTADSLELPILSRLRTQTPDTFCMIPDVSEGLENLLYKAASECSSVCDILEKSKSKRYAMARLRRILMASVLQLKKGMNMSEPPYIRVLAFDERGRELLHAMRSSASVPVITKSADARRLETKAAECFALTAAAHDFYVLGFRERLERKGGEDYRYTPYFHR